MIINKGIDITKENIIKYVDQKQAMLFLIGIYPDLKKKYRSPFRQDNNPGCYFEYANGILRFIDWADNKCLNIFDICMREYNIGFYQAVKLLYNKFIVGKSVEPIPLFYEEKAELRIYKKDYTEIEKQYWEEYGVDSSKLEDENVYSVSEVFLKKKGENFFTPLRLDGFSFAYHCTESNTLKIRSPYDRNGWISTIPHNNLFRQNKLKPADNIIITSSLKDSLTVSNIAKKCNLNVEVTAPQSESVIISPDIIAKFKDVYTNVYTFYDLDRAGLNYAKRNQQIYDLPYFTVPYNRKSEKDISDFHKSYGRRETINMFKDVFERRTNSTFRNVA